jgi:hypothetical protein
MAAAKSLIYNAPEVINEMMAVGSAFENDGENVAIVKASF